MDKQAIKQALAALGPELQERLYQEASYHELPAGKEILRAGQYVKVIPFVLQGLIKVYTRYEERDLLLYYIQPQQSCIMSFAASLRNTPSQVYAQTEEDTAALLLPVELVDNLIRQYPHFNHLFFEQYNQRYAELLQTIHQVLFNRMDERLYDYLLEKSEITGRNPLQMSHRQIAQELGTAREVISRVMKKLEGEEKVRQHSSGIEILKR